MGLFIPLSQTFSEHREILDVPEDTAQVTLDTLQ